MNKKRLFESILIFFTGLLFAIEPVLVLKYFDQSLAPHYFYFTIFKFNTALLVYWLISNKWSSSDREEGQKRSKYFNLILYLIGFVYLMIVALYFFVEAIRPPGIIE